MAAKKKPTKTKADEPRLSRGRTRDGAIFPVSPIVSSLPTDYATTLQEIKAHLRSARVRAVLAANPIVIESYWHTGKIILARQEQAAWGAKVIDRLAIDLKETFPDMSGLSVRNLLAMKIFAREFPDGPIAQQPVAQLPWGHVLQIMQRVKAPAVRDFYIRETLTHGWSRAILELQIQNRLHLRAGKAQTNFALTMPPAESDMAAQLFKDPYLFDFLGTADPRREAEVEQALVDHIQKFLLELGTGFAFVGRQVRLEVGSKDYPLDLLFYLLARSDALRTHAIQNMTGTSGRQRVPSECFNTFWLAVPTPDIARRFDELTAPLMTKIKANSTESRTLATLRDTLLPKLLSGELSVADFTAKMPAEI